MGPYYEVQLRLQEQRLDDIDATRLERQATPPRVSDLAIAAAVLFIFGLAAAAATGTPITTAGTVEVAADYSSRP